MAKELTQQEIYDIYDELYKQLDNAYYEAKTDEDKNLIRDIKGDVFDILTELEKEYIKSNTEKFKELISKVGGVNQRLDELKEKISRIIQRVEIAARVASAIDKVLIQASKYFV